MPVVACPKCPTQLKIPDGAKGNVKCPKCGTIFPVVPPTSAPSFEVVDAVPASKPKPAKSSHADDSDDFEVVDEKPRKKPARDRDDDDEDDERPRSKKRRRDYEEDDEDERPRKKKKKRRDYDDDDDDDDWSRPKPRSAGFGPAKTGALLLGIGAWIYMGTFGVLALLALISWAGSGQPGGIMVLAGLAGLSNWVLSLVGLGFCIAGPERARGTAIAATVVSAIHLVLLFVCFETRSDVYDRIGIGDSAWVVLATTVTSLNSVVPLLVYHSAAFSSGFLVTFIAAGCEVARLILIILTLKKLALAARSGHAADRAGPAVLTVAGVCGGAALAALFVTVLIAEGGLTRAGLHLAAALSLLSYVAYAFMTMAPALLAKDTKDALAARA